MTGTPEVDWLPADTPVDLDNCAREPIHGPGSVQPRGVLLAVGEPDLVVQQVSENLAELTAVAPAEALGRPLAEVLGDVPAQANARSASAFGDLRERHSGRGDPRRGRHPRAGRRRPAPRSPAAGRGTASGSARSAVRDRPVAELTDALLGRMLPRSRAEDDVALVAVRLRPR